MNTILLQYSKSKQSQTNSLTLKTKQEKPYEITITTHRRSNMMKNEFFVFTPLNFKDRLGKIWNQKKTLQCQHILIT